MSDALIGFINKLDQDPKLQAEYRKSPKKTLENNGVSQEDTKLLLEGDISAIKDRLGMSGIKAIMIIAI